MTSYTKNTASSEEIVEAKAPSMIRSRSQLATAYAPGSLFTFE